MLFGLILSARCFFRYLNAKAICYIPCLPIIFLDLLREIFMIKKIAISAVVALPFPFLLFLAGSRLDVFQSETSAIEFLNSGNGVVFYAAAFLLFVVSSVISSMFFSSESSSSSDYDDEQDDSESGPEGKERGTVKWFNVNKGFGFITTEAGDDIFVHFRSIRGRGRRSLRQGQSVRFDISQGDKGLQADNVSVAR